MLPAELPEKSLSTIADLARDPNMTPDKLNQYIDASMRIMNKQAEIEFNQDMAKLKDELKDTPIQKNKANTQTSSRYADLDAIKAIVDPLLAKYGFFDRYEDEFPDINTVRTTCEIVHRMGHSRRNTVQFGLDRTGIKGSVNKTDIHAAASSMTYGQRLSLCRALGIRISEDDDGNAAGSSKINAEQVSIIQGLLEETKTDIALFCSQYLKLPSLADIPCSGYSRVLNALLKKKMGV
jgi:hypothetical protein